MDLLIISPPVANFGQCSSGLSVLVAYLRAQGWDAHQWDLAIDAFHYFHSPENLSECLRTLEGANADTELTDAARRVIAEIDSAKQALRRPGVESEPDTMRWAFETINDAGIVMTGASLGAYEHDFRHFGVTDAFRSFETLDAALADPKKNPFIAYFEECALPRIEKERPAAIGLSLTYFSQVMPGMTLVRLIRERFPEIKIILGGAYLTATEHHTESIPVSVVPADAIVLHDGEEALDHWLRVAIRGEGTANEVANCFVPGESGLFVRAGERNIVHTDLSKLPTPLWIADGLELDRYLVPQYPIPLPLSRGCYWGRCSFCNISCQTGATYRTRPTELALEDMRSAIAETGSNWFDLPVDSYRPKELHELSKALIDSELDIKWGAEVLLDPGFKDNMLEDMAKSGCRTLRFGLESACTETLQAMNKPTRPDKARRILKTCSDNGIQTAVMLIAGFPSETQRQLSQTFDYLAENNDRIDFLTIHQYSLVQGSPMANDPASFGLFLLEQEAVLWTSIPFQNTNPVGMKNEDLPEVVAAMKEGLKEYYPSLGELWTVAIGGWMTFPACCGVRDKLVHPVGGG
jgi:anaerobic magnesium-protoporphyrin IX monomethyl ester cyclase